MTTISIDECIKILELPKDFKELPKDKQYSILKKCYHAQCLKYHPDINKTAEAHEICKRINEANSMLLQAINDGSIKYTKTENQKKYKQGYSSSNAESQVPLDEAYREIFKEFEAREKRKEQEQREELINVLIGVLVVVSVVLIGMVYVLGWELTILIIANALCGGIGLMFKKSQSA